MQTKLSQETIPSSPHSVVSDNVPVVSPQMVSYIKNYITRNASKNNNIQYYGIDDKEVATSEISVLGCGDEEIAEMVCTKTIKKFIRKLEKTYLPICRRQDIQVSRALYLKS